MGREAAGLAAGAFGTSISVLRGHRRAIHPEGCCFHARFEIDEPGPLAVGLLPGGSHEAVVRLSRGANLPARWPDILGLALKVRVGDADLDLLFNSSGPGAAGKYLLLPAQRFFERPYSTILRYDNGPHRLLVGLIPPPGPGPTFQELRRRWNLEDVTFEVVVAPPKGGWRHAGWVIIGEPFPEGEELVFDPWNVPGGAHPGGFLNWLRTRAYPASQRTWGH